MEDILFYTIVMVLFIPWIMSGLKIFKFNHYFYSKNNGVDINTAREDIQRLRNTDPKFNNIYLEMWKWGFITFSIWIIFGISLFIIAINKI